MVSNFAGDLRPLEWFRQPCAGDRLCQSGDPVYGTLEDEGFGPEPHHPGGGTGWNGEGTT